ncbi:glycoside hydrolase family 16 protein, partial [Escherichia coli]|nr:glycoside hydrolase family 16 protein [Escherichia coli]
AGPQYLILNVAVGGWGGDKGIDAGAFPSRMEVEHVRVWQKKPG